MELYKYQGAGNDFLILDNRDGNITHGTDADKRPADSSECLTTRKIAELCDRRYGIGADGVMLLETASRLSVGASDGKAAPLSDEAAFRMVYYNSDGSGGMMCGNGGRCIVAFAADMGFNDFCFEAADGIHKAEILESCGQKKTIRLGMKNVNDVISYDADHSLPKGCFVDTGTRHFVTFSDDLSALDLIGIGREVRYNAIFAPIGVNVNFVERLSRGLKVRTYEKGVEDETYACGTGIVASAIVSYLCGVSPSQILPGGRLRYDIEAVRDSLSVDFMPGIQPCSFRELRASVASDVFLTGPAVRVAKIQF